MKVLIQWREEVDYESEVAVDDDVFLAWLNESTTDHFDTVDDVRVKGGLESLVKEFLDSGDQAEWFDQINGQRDFLGVPDRSLEFVQQVTR